MLRRSAIVPCGGVGARGGALLSYALRSAKATAYAAVLRLGGALPRAKAAAFAVMLQARGVLWRAGTAAGRDRAPTLWRSGYGGSHSSRRCRQRRLLCRPFRRGYPLRLPFDD